tara:strand:+ start:392 stop:1327 length:936 start_codon:yes stop_codon:yes gene_type:complete
MALPLIFVVNAIAGTAIRFAAKKAAQSFVKKYGGKIVSNAGKRKVLSNTASGVKRFMDKFKSTKGGQKDPTKGLKKEDMIALTTKKKPSGGKVATTPKTSNVKPPVSKPKGTSVGSARLKRLEKPREMKNITPKKGSGTSAVPRGGRTGTRTRPMEGANLKKTVLGILNLPKVDKKEGKKDPPLIDNRGLADVPKSKPKKIDPPKSKPKMADVPKSKPKKKNVPVATKKKRTSPISKPDLSGLTGKFGVKGFSRTGSTMTDFLIGFTDGKGGKGRNYDKFMAKDKNGQYKVKTDTLKSMGKRLKEKMKKKK